MSDKHTELELKFDAEKVKLERFMKWGMSKGVSVREFCRVNKGLDWYYHNSTGNVVRHRVGQDKNELTVKLRKSELSTADRVEIDLGFDADSTPKDVAAFLMATGWKLEFILSKDSYIFTIEDTVSVSGKKHNYEYTAVLYDVTKLENERKASAKRRFIEVEIEKGCGLVGPPASIALYSLGQEITETFKVGEPLNDSLYEIYSGKKYLLQQGENN